MMLLYMKKEWLESFKTGRFFIIVGALLALGMLSPIMMKLLPTILENEGMDPALLLQGMQNQKSLLADFVSDLSSLGSLVLIFSFSGSISNERDTGVFVFPLGKGVARSTIVISKWIVASTTAVVSVAIAISVNAIYTRVLFAEQPFTVTEVVWSIVGVSIYMILGISLALLFSSILKGTVVTGLLAYGVLQATALLKFFLDSGTPAAILENVMTYTYDDLFLNSIVTIIVSVLCITCAVVSFKRSQFSLR